MNSSQALPPSRRKPRRRPPGMTSRLAEPSVERGEGWLEIVVPLRTVSLTNQREHWAVRARRAAAERIAVGWSLQQSLARHSVMPPFTVTLTRIAPRRVDTGNLPACVKSPQDSLAAYFGIDDGDPQHEWVYRQEAGPYGLRIRIERRAEPRIAAGGGK